MTHRSTATTNLRISAAIVIGFGAFMILGTFPPVRSLVSLFGDIILWPLDGAQDATLPMVGLLSAITGGVSLGWGALIWGLSGAVAQSHPEAIRKLVLRSYAVWFIADGLASIIAGAPLNIVGNTAFLAAIVWPLRRAFPG